jgi:deoxyribodipyrimidine photolyase-related protein
MVMTKQLAKTLIIVLGDQLTPTLASLKAADPATAVVLMMEVQAEGTYVPHHPQKIALILSAMRHFADELRNLGWTVDYVPLDAPENTQSFKGEVQRAVYRHGATEVLVTWPGEWRVLEDMRTWEAAVGVPVKIVEDDRWVMSRAWFAQWISQPFDRAG